MTKPPIYTLGHGGRTIEEFLALLREHEIQYLVDVRSAPYSRYQPSFNKPVLERHLAQFTTKYVFMGDLLGGRPKDVACYTDGQVDYEKVAKMASYKKGIARLLDAWNQNLRIALVCSERKPESCHRSKLIGRTLHDSGVPLRHIDENDELVDQESVILRTIGGQPSLFGEDFYQFRSRKTYLKDDESDEESGDS